MNYLINRGGSQQGPYSVPDLQNMIAQGQLAPSDGAWCEGMPAWVPVSQVLSGGAPPAVFPPQYGQPPQTHPQQGGYSTYPGGFAPPHGGPAVVQGYAQVCGILGLILAIAGFVIPFVGVLFITPLAIVAGGFALYGQYKTMGIAILVINVVNLIVSPTFWLNMGAGAFSAANGFLTLFDIGGVVVMFILLIRKPQPRTY